MKNIIRSFLRFMLLFSVSNNYSFVASQSSTTDTESESATTDEINTETKTETEKKAELSEEDIETAYVQTSPIVITIDDKKTIVN